MRVSALLEGLPVRIQTGLGQPFVDPVVEHLCDDSRKVVPGCVFIARPGPASDGRTFLRDAIERGATVVIAPPEALASLAGERTITCVAADDPARLVAPLAHRLHGAPTASISVLGVTGTNGKTTIAYLLQQLISGRTERRCGLLGTVEIDDGRTRTASALTTPGAIELAELFARMVGNGCTHAAMEVSSHALDQGRVDGVRFACGLFTNLTGDHLDYHGTMERYAAAKALLFAALPSDAPAIVNADDPWADRVARGGRIVRCSALDAGADCRSTIESVDLDGMRVRFEGPWGDLRVRLPLVGRHNAMNALQACAAAWTQGVAVDALAEGLERCEAPPGRLQPVRARRDSGDDVFSVLVDYAHTDDALLNVLSALRPVIPEGGVLRVVFGCGGDRDRTKRPRMAAVACEHADEVVVTSDNPRTEDPTAIVADILAGVPAASASKVHVEVDRATAIAFAVGRAHRGDVVLIAGKGHEDYQIIGTEKRPFDDRLTARAAIEARRGTVATGEGA